MRYAADHKEQTHRRLLKEASAIIRSDGLDGLTIGVVSKRLGITHGGFYFHFASREDFVAQAVIGMFDNHYGPSLKEAGPSDPKATLMRLVDAYLSIEHCNRRQTGCPIPILAADHARLPAAARKRFTRAVAGFVASVAALIERFDDRDAEERAMSAVAEMIGAVAIGRVFESAQAERAMQAARASVRAKLGLM